MDPVESNNSPDEPKPAVSEVVIHDVEAAPSFQQKATGFSFGKALLWCLLFLIITQGLPSIMLAIVIVAKFPGVDAQNWIASDEARPYMQAVLFAVQCTVIVFSLIVLRRKLGGDWRRRIAWRLPCIEHTLLVILAVPALLIVSISLESFVVRYVPSFSKFGLPSVNQFFESTGIWPWSIAVLIIGVGPALGEELWCRGFLGQGLSARYGKWAGLLMTSFLFGLIHLEPPQAILAGIMGIVLHLSYIATRSIFVPILLHFLNNSLVILSISKTGNVPIVTSLEHTFHHRPSLSVCSALLVLISIGLILYQSRVRIWMPNGQEAPESLYPHVEWPVATSANIPLPGPFASIEIGALIVAVGLFAAVWVGW